MRAMAADRGPRAFLQEYVHGRGTLPFLYTLLSFPKHRAQPCRCRGKHASRNAGLALRAFRALLAGCRSGCSGPVHARSCARLRKHAGRQEAYSDSWRAMCGCRSRIVKVDKWRTSLLSLRPRKRQRVSLPSFHFFLRWTCTAWAAAGDREIMSAQI